MQVTYVITKREEPPKWVSENKADGTVNKSYHTAIRRAINSTLRKHPGIRMVYLTINTEE